MEQLSDERDDRDHGGGDPENAETRHQRLNGSMRDALGERDHVRMVLVAVAPPRLARMVYSPLAAVPPKLP